MLPENQSMRPLGRVALEACIEYLAPRAMMFAVVAAIVGFIIAPWWALAAIAAVACCAGALGRKKPRVQQPGTGVREVSVGCSSPEASFQKNHVIASANKRKKEKRRSFSHIGFTEEKKPLGVDMGVVAVNKKNGLRMMLPAWPSPAFS